MTALAAGADPSLAGAARQRQARRRGRPRRRVRARHRRGRQHRRHRPARDVRPGGPAAGRPRAGDPRGHGRHARPRAHRSGRLEVRAVLPDAAAAIRRIEASPRLRHARHPLPRRLADPRRRAVRRCRRVDRRGSARSTSTTSAAASAPATPTPTTRRRSDAYLDRTVEAARAHLPPGAEIILEPGRSMVASATPPRSTGWSRVKRGAPTFVAVDGGMGDNLEVALYQQRFEAALVEPGRRRRDGHPGRSALRVRRRPGRRRAAARPARRRPARRPATGAYCYTMSNNYNGARRSRSSSSARAAARPVVRRETWADLLARDVPLGLILSTAILTHKSVVGSSPEEEMPVSTYDVVDRRWRPQRARRGRVPGPGGPADGRARAAPDRRRRRRLRAPVRAGLHRHLAVVRRVLAAAHVVRDLTWCGTATTSTRRGRTSRRAPTGRYLSCPSDHGRRHEQIAKFSDEGRRRERPAGRPGWTGSAAVVGPLLTEIPPKVGSSRPATCSARRALLAQAARTSTSAGRRPHPAVHGSVADLVEDRFESDAMRGRARRCPASSARGPGRAAPARRTSWLHHHIGDLGDGQIGAWGFPRGGMGGVTQAMARRPRVLRRGDPYRRHRSRASRPPADGRTGVVLESGEEITAPTVITTAHPKISFLRPASTGRAARRLRRGHRALEDPLRHREDQPRRRPAAGLHLHPGVRPAGARRHDRAGRVASTTSRRRSRRRSPAAPPTLPFADICIPSVFDPTAGARGPAHRVHVHPVGAAHLRGAARRRARRRYADRLIARMEAVAPGFTDSIVGTARCIGPHEMQDEYGLVGGNIFHGELTPGRCSTPPGRRLRGSPRPRSTGSTRPARPPMAAAGSPASRAETLSARSSPTGRRPPGATASRAAAGERSAGRAPPAPLRRAGGLPARARAGAARQLDLPRPARRRSGLATPGHRRARARSARRRRPARRVRPRDHHDRDGELRAHANVCRHRARRSCRSTPPSPAPEPCAVGALRCPYHSWTYDLDGRLIKAPHTDDVEDFDPTVSRCTRWAWTPGAASSRCTGHPAAATDAARRARPRAAAAPALPVVRTGRGPGG